MIATVNSRVKSTKRQTQTSDKEREREGEEKPPKKKPPGYGLRGKQKPNELVPRAGNTTSGGRQAARQPGDSATTSPAPSATLIKAKWPLLELQL